MFLEDLDRIFQTSSQEMFDDKYFSIYNNDVCHLIEDIELFNVLIQLFGFE